MHIRNWSNDLVTEIDVVDKQHQEIFTLINRFAEQADTQLESFQIREFLKQLSQYTAAHFKEEEHWMQLRRYPLAEDHVEMHRAMAKQLGSIQRQLELGELETPGQTLLDFSAALLNDHIAKDDLSFAEYCLHSKAISPEELLGRRCEVISMERMPLGFGRIQEINEHQITIEPLYKDIPALRMGTVVKLTFTDASGEVRVIIARVLASRPEELKLFNTKIIAPKNKRGYPRVNCRLPVSLLSARGPIEAMAMDISHGGMLLETQVPLPLKHLFYVQFEVNKHLVTGYCDVVRIAQNHKSDAFWYGCLFEAETPEMLNIVSEFIFHSQAHRRVKTS